MWNAFLSSPNVLYSVTNTRIPNDPQPKSYSLLGRACICFGLHLEMNNSLHNVTAQHPIFQIPILPMSKPAQRGFWYKMQHGNRNRLPYRTVQRNTTIH
jgi:hypothetical protein